jgi:hypothetical protein
MATSRNTNTDVVELREIVSIQGDAENAYGSTPGGNNTVLAFNQGLQYLNQAATAQANATQFKYLQFQENMKDYYKRFNEVDVNGIMESDYPDVNEEYATLAKDIADNYDVIRNPNADPEKFAELKEREAKLRGTIARSKQHVAFREFNNEFMKQHPEFNTEANKARIQEFNNKPIGERKVFPLDTPFAYSPAERAKIANDRATAKITTEQTNGKYFTKDERKLVYQDEYDKAWDALGTTQDKTGRPVFAAAQDTYSKLPPSLTGGMDFNTWDRETGRSLMNQGDESTTMKEDQYGLQDDAQKFQGWQNSLNRNLQRDLAKDKDLQNVGRLYNEALASGFTTGFVNPALLQNLFGDETQVETKQKTGGGYGPNGEVLPSSETTVKVPKIQATGSRRDAQGNLVVSRVNNETGQPLPDIVMTYPEARVAFYNIAGAKNVGAVADASEEYRRQHKLDPRDPNLQQLSGHFRFGDDDKMLTDAEYYRKYKVRKPVAAKP